MKTSVIVPIYQLHAERLRNFLYILDQLENGPFDEIIIIEQVTTRHQPWNLGKCRYLPVTREGSLNKSALINLGVILSNNDHILINDADIWLPYNEILSEITASDKFVQPFDNFVKLSAEGTDEFISSDGDFIAKHVKVMDAPGAGAFYIHKQAFMSIRGMDERYQGWGYEDLEFGLRASIYLGMKELTQFVGVHLYHESSNDAGNLPLYRTAKMSMYDNKYLDSIISPF